MGECLGVCFALQGWIALYGLDEPAWETCSNPSNGARRQVHTESLTGLSDCSVEKKKCSGGKACRGVFQAAQQKRKNGENRKVGTNESRRPYPVTDGSFRRLDPRFLRCVVRFLCMTLGLSSFLFLRVEATIPVFVEF